MANNTTCFLPDWYRVINEKTYFSVYYVVTPSYFVLGLFGHILFVSAFLQQLKHDSAYLYQIFTSANEILEIITFTLFVTTFHWFSGFVNPGANWFMANYACMWYAAHMAIPLINMFITSSMFLSLSTTADRLYALLRPFQYKNANHRRHKIAAFSFSFIVGIGTSVFDCFRFQLTWNGDVNTMSVDEVYVGSMTATVLAELRNAVRILGLVALIVSNTILTYAYRRHNRQIEDMSTNSGARTDAVVAKEAQRRLREKTLLILTICDSVLTTIGVSLLVSYFAAVYISPSFTACEGVLLASVLDGTLQITEVSNFYIVFAASKQFRDMVGSAIPKCCQRALRLGEFKTVQTLGQNVSQNSISRRTVNPAPE